MTVVCEQIEKRKIEEEILQNWTSRAN